jgi:hypothetical protein
MASGIYVNHPESVLSIAGLASRLLLWSRPPPFMSLNRRSGSRFWPEAHVWFLLVCVGIIDDEEATKARAEYNVCLEILYSAAKKYSGVRGTQSKRRRSAIYGSQLGQLQAGELRGAALMRKNGHSGGCFPGVGGEADYRWRSGHSGAVSCLSCALDLKDLSIRSR